MPEEMNTSFTLKATMDANNDASAKQLGMQGDRAFGIGVHCEWAYAHVHAKTIDSIFLTLVARASACARACKKRRMRLRCCCACNWKSDSGHACGSNLRVAGAEEGDKVPEKMPVTSELEVEKYLKSE
eukprot:6175262-Pleurochrysis_carterae.AAC.1